jgi:hypothetical protein
MLLYKAKEWNMAPTAQKDEKLEKRKQEKIARIIHGKVGGVERADRLCVSHKILD